MHRILYYKQIKMFEKLVFDNHNQFARFADHMNENYKKFEDKWADKVEALNEKFNFLLSSQENIEININNEFDKVEEYIKNTEKELWIEIRNIREEWCEKNRNRITEIEECLDDYIQRINTRIHNLEKLLHNNVGIQTSLTEKMTSLEENTLEHNFALQTSLTQKVSSLEGSMLDKFCKIEEKMNISERDQVSKICDLYCCINAAISHNKFLDLPKALMVCFPNIKFNEIPNDTCVRMGKSMYPDSPFYK
jgi:hypothetical protein